MTRVLLLGDLAPVDIRHAHFDVQLPDGPDLVLANLETPLDCADLAPAVKAGPHLCGCAAALEGVSDLAPHVVLTLANNHLADYGVAGIERTLTRLAEMKLHAVGAGTDGRAATAPFSVTTPDGHRLAVVAGSETQFGTCHENCGGVAALDDLADRIRNIRTDHDCVIATVHGGAEDTAWPSPQWQRRLRGLIEAGANLVHAHHPHHRQGFERWQDGWILYGPGHTLVNPARWKDEPDGTSGWGFLFDTQHPTSAPSATHVRCGNIHAGVSVCIAPVEPHTDFSFYNAPLQDAPLLNGLWQEYASKLWADFYAPGLLGGGTAPARIKHHLRESLRPLFNPEFPEHHLAWLFHVFANSTHTEAVTTVLGLRCGQIPDRRSAKSRELYRSLSRNT